jgi:glucose/arabinose dehydrogenase
MSISTSKDHRSIRPKANAHRRRALATCLTTALIAGSFSLPATAQLPTVAPSMVDPNLVVTKVAFQLDQPTSMAFIGPNDILVTEKASGRVKRIINNVVQPTPVLDSA